MAAIKYLQAAEKKSLDRDAASIKLLDPYIGDLPIEHVHAGTLEKFIDARKKAGLSAGTINRDLAVVKVILSQAARLWRDESGRTWLDTTPMIPSVVGPARAAYPLSWIEQAQLFAFLPSHLRSMAVFGVNTGCREQEICQLRWKWEIQLPQLATSVFVLPAEFVKGRLGRTKDRLVVLNSRAREVIESQRMSHPEFVFTYKGHPLTGMNNNGWRRAREQAGLTQVRVHDLRHTFGRRLRAAGVSDEDRADLLGHANGRVTTHYSMAEVGKLLEAVEKISDCAGQPELTVINLRRQLHAS